MPWRRLPGLKVIARTSAFAFKGQNSDIRRIAETLGVANILEGSVRRSGNRIRVTAQLITATDGTHLWSERYDRELADVFAVQDEISAAISKALEVRLSPQAAAKPRYTPKLPAYEALLKARHFHWKVTAESMDQAKPFFEQAIALDPQFALAHALYADYLFGRATMGLSPLRELAPVIRSLAHRALELDASLADAHAPLCMLAAVHDYDWKEARHQFTLATPGGQGSPQTHMECGWAFLIASGRREEAVEQLRLAVQGDPLHLTHRGILAVCLGCGGTLCRGGGAASAEPGSGSQFLPDPLPPGGHLHRAPDVCPSASLRRKGVFPGALVPSTYWHVRGTIGSHGPARPRAAGVQNARFERGLRHGKRYGDLPHLLRSNRSGRRLDRKGDRGTRSPCPAATAKCDRGAVTPEPALAQVGGADESVRVCGNQCALS